MQLLNERIKTCRTKGSECQFRQQDASNRSKRRLYTNERIPIQLHYTVPALTHMKRCRIKTEEYGHGPWEMQRPATLGRRMEGRGRRCHDRRLFGGHTSLLPLLIDYLGWMPEMEAGWLRSTGRRPSAGWWLLPLQSSRTSLFCCCEKGWRGEMNEQREGWRVRVRVRRRGPT
jgi:hypothetical protein